MYVVLRISTRPAPCYSDHVITAQLAVDLSVDMPPALKMEHSVLDTRPL
jgi:hypothetical protein